MVHDLPGVGENLIDHPESIIIWKLKRPMGPESVMDADCALFVNRLHADERPDLMYHTYQLPFTFNTERLGYEVPDDRWCICMTPNVPRSRPRGRLWLLSKDPEIKPALDFRYFTTSTATTSRRRRRPQDRPQGGGDGAVPDWIDHEIAPGQDVTSDADLSTYGRAVTTPSTTRRAPAGWARRTTIWLWSTRELRVRGIEGLSIADGSVFPTMPTLNPMVCTYMIGERAAELVRER